MSKTKRISVILPLAAVAFAIALAALLAEESDAASYETNTCLTDDGLDFNISEAIGGDTPQKGRLVTVTLGGTDCMLQNSIYTVRESNATLTIDCNLAPLNGTAYSLATVDEVGWAFGMKTGTIGMGKVLITANDSTGKSVYVSPIINLTQIVDHPAIIELDKDQLDAGMDIHVFAIYAVSYIDRWDWSASQKLEMAAAGACSPLAIGALLYALNHTKEAPVYGYKGVLEATHYSVITDDARSTVIRNLTQDYSTDESEIIRLTSSIESGGVSVKGFEVDTALNPHNSVSVYLNGALVNGEGVSSTATRFTTPGHYIVVIKGPCKDTVTKEIDIIDLPSIAKCAKSIVNGNPVLSEDQMLKVIEGEDLEGELLCYDVGSRIDLNGIPCVSRITLLRDGKDVSVDDVLTVGMYDVTITIGRYSGDVITLHSRFNVIDTAKQPTLNQMMLDSYTEGLQTALEGYTVSFDTLGVGRILAFTEDYEKALELSLKNEWSHVISNGPVYSYKDVNYTDAELLLDAIESNAKLAVEHVFMPSRGITVGAVSELDDLVGLKIDHDVFVSIDEHKSNHTVFTQPYAYIENEGTIEYGKTDFAFFENINGYAISDSIKLAANGKTYTLVYGTSLFHQLEEYGIGSGSCIITESLNGRSHTYVFEYYSSGEKPSVTIKSDDENIMVDNKTMFRVNGPFNISLDKWSVATITTDDGFTKILTKELGPVDYFCSVTVTGLNGQMIRFRIDCVFSATTEESPSDNSVGNNTGDEAPEAPGSDSSPGLVVTPPAETNNEGDGSNDTTRALIAGISVSCIAMVGLAGTFILRRSV